YGESEFARFGVAGIPSVCVRPPRVAGVPVAFECRLDRIVRVGEGPVAGHVVLGRIARLHADESALAGDGKPDPQRLDLIGRAGRNDYVRLGELFRLERPA
ncbi:MAG: flavin reductase family protein, partial [Verrucomicrobiae bacterium]|nr:flavin reductase family protein [Verrucomicrobiae bacterium]